MNRLAIFAILSACALLEAGGDALARKGMQAVTLPSRVGLYVCAAAALFAYGWLVNRPPWSFGALLGTYIVVLFVVAQAMGYFLFGDKPSGALLVGGALIVAGGLVISLSQ